MRIMYLIHCMPGGLIGLCLTSVCLVNLACSKSDVKQFEFLKDVKEFKKVVRTKTNLLAVFLSSNNVLKEYTKVFSEVVASTKGSASLVFVNCAEAKKLCKKQKISNVDMELKHFQNGDFHKIYDRRLIAKSMIAFLMDPSGDPPWEEEEGAENVRHIDTEVELNSFLKKEQLPILIMFYAPWCGHCKRLKPEFSAAATELVGRKVLAGMNVDKAEAMNVRKVYNITGFPTLVYFKKGKAKFRYGGENSKDGIITWLDDPKPPEPPKEETPWSAESQNIVHLTDSTMQPFIDSNPSVLVMFYAPWCGHCKKMKPEFEEAAKTLIDESVEGVLAAVDATKETKLGTKYEVKGYPTVKYFQDGKFKFDVNERTADKIVEFMKNPSEPPPPPPPEPQWSDEPSEVKFPDDEGDFKSLLKRKKHALVMFYAPWCGHCKMTKPEFISAAQVFKDDLKVTFVGIDCTSSKYGDLCSQNGVTGFPTLKYYSYGKPAIDYSGGRKKEDFIAFMRDPSAIPEPASPDTPPPEEDWVSLEGGDKVHLINSVDEFESFLPQHSTALVMFYAPWCGHCKAMKPAFALAALQLSTIDSASNIGALAAVDATQVTDLSQQYKVQSYPTLKLFKGGKFVRDFEGQRISTAFIEALRSLSSAPPPPSSTQKKSKNKEEL